MLKTLCVKSTYTHTFSRNQVLGESYHPLLFRKGKRLKEEGKRREPPPDTPVVDVSCYFV